MDVTEEKLDEISSDRTAQQLLYEAAQKKAAYWDALSRLERYVGLTVEGDVLDSLAISFETSPTPETSTEVDPELLRDALKQGFRQGGEVMDETGIAVPEE